jgi:hypothetical protein
MTGLSVPLSGMSAHAVKFAIVAPSAGASVPSGASVLGASEPVGASVLVDESSPPHATRPKPSAAVSRTGTNLPLVILFIYSSLKVGLGAADSETLVAVEQCLYQCIQKVNTPLTIGD